MELCVTDVVLISTSISIPWRDGCCLKDKIQLLTRRYVHINCHEIKALSDGTIT